MLPKNSKHYIQPTADSLNIDYDLAEDIISFYYSEVRKTLCDLKCHNIQIENLGTFKAKDKELPKLYKKYTNHLSVLKTDTFTQMAIKKEITDKLQKVKRLQTQIREDKIRKLEFLKKKYEK
tara:strand:- start:11169 stop:11534 length:366 start_codon:yes stop_codon:yes gene_type:complete